MITVVVWYRSAAVAGIVFINSAGKTEILNVEAFLFTMGKASKDAARAGALAAAAEAIAKASLDELGVRGIRIWTHGEEFFRPINPAESAGLGAYRVGVRVKDGEIVAKTDVRFRRSFRTVFDAIVDSVERAKEKLWRLFG